MRYQADQGRSGRAAFAECERGNVAVIFGLSFVPLVLMLGAGVDYGRLVITRSNLQQATDAAVLAVARNITGTTTEQQAQSKAQVYLLTNVHGAVASVTKATISGSPLTLCIDTRAQLATTIMRIANFESMTTQATACAQAPGGVSGTYEIALVLDNSGSMTRKSANVTKMKALQDAAKSFVETMFTKSSNVKMSIAPFAAGVVAFDPTTAANRTADWIDKNGKNSQHWIAFGGATAAKAAGFTSRFDIFDKLKAIDASWDWGGCLELPKYPNNVKDTTPTSSDPETLFVPYLAPDEPDIGYKNDYIDDDGTATTYVNKKKVTTSTCSDVASGEWNQLTHVCKYNVASAAGGGAGPNSYCPDYSTQTVMPLTATQATVTTKIDQLVANGNTNLHEGFMWGWRTLSPNAPFANGRAYNTADNHKVIVFMTDGFNNWASAKKTVTGSTYESAGYYSYNGTKNERFPDGSTGDHIDYQTLLNGASGSKTDYHDDSREMQDELTREACANAKTAGIEIYTIGFSIPSDPIDQQGLDLLKACASGDDHYFAATNVSELNAAFSTIGAGAGKLRLTK